MLIQAFVSETPVEALDESILHRVPGLMNRDLLPACEPGIESLASLELGFVVGTRNANSSGPKFNNAQDCY